MITERDQRIASTILAVVVPLLAGIVAAHWFGLDPTITSVLMYGWMVVWLVRIWWPRRTSQSVPA